MAEHFEETPALILACDDMSGILKRMAKGWRHTIEGARAIGPRHTLRMLPQMPRFLTTGETASIYPAVQDLLIAARAHGLGATLTTWRSLFEPEYRHALGMPPRTKIFAIVPVGYPRGHFGPVTRLPGPRSDPFQPLVGRPQCPCT